MFCNRVFAGLGLLLLSLGVSPTITRGQQCDDFDECTNNDMCTVEDGVPVCMGTPAAGPGCDDFNDCTINDRCGVDPLSQEIRCIGDNVPIGTSCQGGCGTCQSLSPFPIPGIPLVCQPIPARIGQACESNTFGPCFDTVCQEFGQPPFSVAFCGGSGLKECPDTDGNRCTDFCNPETGRCENPGQPPCFPVCQSCNPTTGACEPANVGAACDDFDDCSAESHCGIGGSCVPGPATASSPTPTTRPVTPTRTPTSGGATVTPTRAGPTNTPRTPTQTSTPGGVCAGDCNEDRKVAINELVTGVNIALERALLNTCPSFDRNSSNKVEINELIGGVNNALGGCPP